MLWGNEEAEEGRWRSRDMVICSSPPLRAGEPQVELSDYSSGLIFTDKCMCVCVCASAHSNMYVHNRVSSSQFIILFSSANLKYVFDL